MPDTPTPMTPPDATPVGADDLAKHTTESEQGTLKRAEDSGQDATGGTGILTGIAQA